MSVAVFNTNVLKKVNIDFLLNCKLLTNPLFFKKVFVKTKSGYNVIIKSFIQNLFTEKSVRKIL